MNDHNDSLDKNFRDQLVDHEIQPDDHVWEGIQSAMNKNSRRVWLILAPIILLLAAFLFYLFADINPTSPTETNEETSSTEVMSLNDKGQEEVNTYIASQEKSSANTNSNVKATDPSKSIEQTRGARRNTSNVSIDSETRSSTKSIEASKRNSDLPSAAQDRKTTRPDFQNRKSRKVSMTKENSALETSGQKAKTETSSLSDISSVEKVSESALQERADSEENRTVLHSFLKGSSSLQSTDEGFQRFTVNHFRNNEEDHKRALNEIDLCALMYPKTNECPTFKDLNRRFQLDVYGLVGKKFSSLSTNDNIAGLGNYLEKRRATETPLWNVGIGIRLANQWTNGVSVKGGLQLSRGQVRLNYLDESQRTTVVNVSIDTIVDEMGNTTVVWDTISIVETNIVPVEEYNSFTQLDIPVTLGYTFLGRNFDIELNAGVMFNILFTKEGHILGPEEDEINSIDPAEQGAINAYRSDLGFSIITSAALNYHITDQISVFAEPQLRYFLEPVSPELYSLRESWFHVNLLLGTRYSF